ncbi:MAG: 50S ribosomal protein L30 [Clostridia bacterium]|jgi:large subunit ribosomal protein L30|nr:50S ribosomal protein L30 [Clostridia bacterium]
MATKKKAAGLTVKLVKSTIGSKKDQIATVESLGLRKLGDTSLQPDNAQTRGKVNKVSHLVKIVESK